MWPMHWSRRPCQVAGGRLKGLLDITADDVNLRAVWQRQCSATDSDILPQRCWTRHAFWRETLYLEAATEQGDDECVGCQASAGATLSRWPGHA